MVLITWHGVGICGMPPETQYTPRKTPQLGVPRIAEMVADDLRQRIINGDLADGMSLPRQEDLVKEFGISLPSLREALRILEAEGLLTVRRGNAGAMVHRPTADASAFMFGTVLRSHNVALGDLSAAMRLVESACAGLCAHRSNRRQIANRLLKLNEEAAELLGDDARFIPMVTEFHDRLARSCGVETLYQVTRVLEKLWVDYASYFWTREHRDVGTYPAPQSYQKILESHKDVAEAIHRGDRAAAELVWQLHIDDAHRELLGESSNALLSSYPAVRGANSR